LSNERGTWYFANGVGSPIKFIVRHESNDEVFALTGWLVVASDGDDCDLPEDVIDKDDDFVAIDVASHISELSFCAILMLMRWVCAAGGSH
jgi:hypothetical protein